MIDHAAYDLYYIITVSSSSWKKNYMVFNVYVCAGDWKNFILFSINMKRYAECVRGKRYSGLSIKPYDVYQ